MPNLSAKQSLHKRLDGYWKMELANVLGVPLIVYVLAHWLKVPLGLLTLVTVLPVCALLVVGATYWRAKLKQIGGGRQHIGGGFDTGCAAAIGAADR